MTQKNPRMGRIGYLNVLPIYYPLESGRIAHDFELISAPPAMLNNMMARGELHISSASCFEYAKNPEKYFLVRDLSIGSRGPVMSVLLLASCPVEQLDGKEILITGETATSVALLRLILEEHYDLRANFVTGNVSAHLAQGHLPHAFLAIGDEALRLRNHKAYPYCIDLAEIWRRWTGLPFIFGIWVISRAAAAAQIFSSDPTELLHKARDWSFDHLDIILDLTAHGCPISRSDLEIYYRDGLLYTLREEEQEGLLLFYKKLAQTGVIKAVPQLCFYEWCAS